MKDLKYMAGCAAVIVGLVTGGCLEKLTRYQAVNAKTAKQAAAIHTTADMIGAEEQYQRDLSIAERGASNVNVNVGTSNYNTQPTEEGLRRVKRALDEKFGSDNKQLTQEELERVKRALDEKFDR